MIRDSLESPDRLSVSLPRGCDPTGCRFKDRRTHKRHLVSLFHYPVFREHLLLMCSSRSGPGGPSLLRGRGRRGVGDLFPLAVLVKFFLTRIFSVSPDARHMVLLSTSSSDVGPIGGCDAAGRLSGSFLDERLRRCRSKFPAAGWLSAGGGVYPEPCSRSSAVRGIFSVSVFSWLPGTEATGNAEAEEED